MKLVTAHIELEQLHNRLQAYQVFAESLQTLLAPATNKYKMKKLRIYNITVVVGLNQVIEYNILLMRPKFLYRLVNRGETIPFYNYS